MKQNRLGGDTPSEALERRQAMACLENQQNDAMDRRDRLSDIWQALHRCNRLSCTYEEWLATEARAARRTKQASP